jgi:D-glycero-alpha-D-manno-heptose-7-phosphate kinase
MIITKTPFRASFAGGGTDLPAFYEKEDGFVVSTAINLFVYLAVHRFFERRFVLKYSETENVEKVEAIRHGLIRECLKICEVTDPVEITSFADIPSKGSGLGSSSAFAVGLIAALHALGGRTLSSPAAAHLACEVEIGRLGEPIGRQDQYACACGGLNALTFHGDHTVRVEPIPLGDDARRHLDEHLVMVYTGRVRQASQILAEQKRSIEEVEEQFQRLRDLKALALDLEQRLRREEVDAIGPNLHEGWQIKRSLVPAITWPGIDAAYEAALAAGATGGKLLGAGGGGFLMFYCPPQRRADVLRALSPMRWVPARTELRGTRIPLLE